MKKSHTLIAGVGNIFRGDDAFGVEVVQALLKERDSLPSGVRAVDFGIRGYDLAYTLAEGYEKVIFVDTVSQGDNPGTLCLLEVDPENLERTGGQPDGHSLDPVSVLQMARTLKAPLGAMFLVGCEPAVLESDEIGLSAPLQAAVPRAVEMIHSLLSDPPSAATRPESLARTQR